MVASGSGQVWLTGFGIATDLSQEREAPKHPQTIAGTLAYMAPEQTGRMNRSIDSRSDLYSLGVTLYQMLTGALPFIASDPVELVHCHIAQAAVAARRAKERRSRSVVSYSPEASGQGARGALSNRRRAGGRPQEMPGGFRAAGTHRAVRDRRA